MSRFLPSLHELSGEVSPPTDRLLVTTRRAFEQRFGREPRWIVAAPGRVNLIGEHVDYNDGLVLPMAIERHTLVAADLSPAAHPGMAAIWAANLNDFQEVPLGLPADDRLPLWTRYVTGVIGLFGQTAAKPPPFDAVICSDLPLGGGLSSSASLEVAVATLMELLTGQSLLPVDKALLCQRAEHESVGVPCGIMDQFSAVLCRNDHLMLLDCRDQQVSMVPLADPDVAILVVDSGVKHELSESEYAVRRQQCRAAAQALRISSLREANAELLGRQRKQLGELLYRRAHHVVTEIERVQLAAHAIKRHDWSAAGELMFASHVSLRDDYQVSCAELDFLTDESRRLCHEGAVYGARMTGGGFGGATVHLVPATSAQQVADMLCTRYRDAFGLEASAFITRPTRGSHTLTQPTNETY